MAVIISSDTEFDFCLKRGVNPLFWQRDIKIDINYRIQKQYELFGDPRDGNYDIVKAHEKYYKYCFEHSTMHCENCGIKLFSMRNIDSCYSAIYISHILTRKANPEMAHDPRNHNILCPKCHEKWENGERRAMLIYLDNQEIIKELKHDYFCTYEIIS